MPRRRSASPRASAPVRSAPPARTTMPARTAPPPSPAAATPIGQPQQRQPGLLGQMAATAGGVAIGSAVGHAVGNMFSGGRAEEVAPAQAAPAQQDKQQYSNPCEFEWRQFLECSQKQSDVSFCQSFNDMFKECKARYGQ